MPDISMDRSKVDEDKISSPEQRKGPCLVPNINVCQLLEPVPMDDSQLGVGAF